MSGSAGAFLSKKTCPRTSCCRTTSRRRRLLGSRLPVLRNRPPVRPHSSTTMRGACLLLNRRSSSRSNRRGSERRSCRLAPPPVDHRRDKREAARAEWTQSEREFPPRVVAIPAASRVAAVRRCWNRHTPRGKVAARPRVEHLQGWACRHRSRCHQQRRRHRLAESRRRRRLPPGAPSDPRPTFRSRRELARHPAQ